MGNIASLSQVALPAAPTTSTQAANKAYVDLSMRTVSALANITSPATGQLALLTTDLMIYRYTGSAWLGIQHTAPGGGYAQYRRTTAQPIPTNTPTRLKLVTASNTHSDITANAAFDIFTLNRTGTWRLETNAAIPSQATGTGFTLWIANQNDSVRHRLVNDKINNQWISARYVGAEIQATAGDQVGFWVYHDVGSEVSTDVGQIPSSASLRWTGP